MLKHLKFDVTFSNGDGRSGDHHFEGGLTGLAGANEAGKSLRFEYIRFGLFGADALRANKDKYQAVNVTLVWDMGGVEYMTVRTLNTAVLHKNAEPIVKGTTAVNKAVVNLLGYEMKVFDVANACLQGKVEELTDMKPTERKTMVDKVVGLDGIDNLAKVVGERAKNENAGLVALERLVEPLTEPTKPEGYVLTIETEQLIKDREVLARERAGLLGQLEALKCEQPGLPIWDNHVTESLVDLQSQQANRTAQEKQLAEAKAENNKVVCPAKPEGVDVEKLQAYLVTKIPEEFAERNDYLMQSAKYPKSAFSNDIWNAIIAFNEKVEMNKKTEKLRADSSVTCPHCSKAFALQQSKIDEKEQSVAWTKEILDKQDKDTCAFLVTNASRYSTLEAGREIEKNKAHDEFIKNNPTAPVVSGEFLGKRYDIEKLLTQHQAYVDGQKAAQQAQERVRLCEQSLLGYPDVSAKIKQVIEQDAANSLFNQLNDRYQAYKAKLAEYEPRLLELAEVDNELAVLRTRLWTDRQYENGLAQYSIKVESQSRIAKDIAEQKAKVEQLKVVREALATLKPKVKTYLMPSLNGVASNLLSQMTNGVRNTIYISEDFDILVDGQGVETLSGSGKAVVNLAIRIALGSVLTNKVFSVFLADEVDAAMRGERAAYTAQCFKNLTKIVKQIIIISHKELEVDRLIQV